FAQPADLALVPFAPPHVCSGSILRVRNFLPERSVLARLSLSAFDRNLAHWSQLGPAGAFSTSFESWGSTQRGKGIVRIWVVDTGLARNPQPGMSQKGG